MFSIKAERETHFLVTLLSLELVMKVKIDSKYLISSKLLILPLDLSSLNNSSLEIM